MLNVIKYLNNDSFKDQFLIAADDTPLNMLAFEFANNYSNRTRNINSTYSGLNDNFINFTNAMIDQSRR